MGNISEYAGAAGGPEARPPRGGRFGRNQPQQQTDPRFNVPGPAERPELNYMSQQDLDALIERIKAEEALPPHKKNAARIAAMKQQALDMMRRLESLWVQETADRLLPRIDEAQP